MGWLRRQFELARGGGGGNIPAMEGMRGVAVGLVFLAHYAILSRPWLEPGLARELGTLVDRGGRVGVDLFFILSGFLIYGALLRRARPYGPYVWRRLVRIYPTFAAVFLLYVVLVFAVPRPDKLPSEAGEAALMLIGNALLLPGLCDVRPLNSATWTLSYEMAFYLVIPLLIAGLGLRRRSATWRVGCAIAVMAAILALQAPTQLIMFGFGMLAYEAVQARRGVGPWPALVAAGLALGAAAALDPDGGLRVLRFVLIGGASYVFTLGALGRPDGWLARGLAWTPLRWFGNMSYSYYLIHGLALNALAWAVGTLVGGGSYGVVVHLLALPLAFAVTLVPGALLFLAIERPLSLRHKSAT